MKKPKPAYYLCLQVNAPRRMSETAFGHLSVQFCVGAMERGELQPRWPENNPDIHPGSECVGIGFACQIDSDARDEQSSYAWRVGIITGTPDHPVETEAVVRCAKALTALTKAHAIAEARFGPPKTFGQFIAYHLGAFNVQGMFESGSKFADSGWRMHGPDMITYSIDARVSETVRGCRVAVGKPEFIEAA